MAEGVTGNRSEQDRQRDELFLMGVGVVNRELFALVNEQTPVREVRALMGALHGLVARYVDVPEGYAADPRLVRQVLSMGDGLMARMVGLAPEYKQQDIQDRAEALARDFLPEGFPTAGTPLNDQYQ